MADIFDPNRRYKIEPSRNVVTETTSGEGGIRFGVTEIRPATANKSLA